MTLPLLLLPGMMCDARLFAPQIEALGSGREVRVGDITGADRVERIAAQVLDAAPQRFALAGLSMGGIVAMEVARQRPDRVAGLALLDTNPLAESEEVRARRAPQIERVRAGGLAEVMANEMKPFYLGPHPRRDEILALCMDMALDLGPDVFIRQSLALRDRPDQTDTLRRIRTPALVLCGRDDRLCPVSRHELMVDIIPHAQLTIIENAGHLPTLEAPDGVTTALNEWLARIG